MLTRLIVIMELHELYSSSHDFSNIIIISHFLFVFTHISLQISVIRKMKSHKHKIHVWNSAT